jgi:hypothetical protein
MRASRGVRVVLFAVLSAASLLADVTGTIFGVVRDKSQAVVAGAKVTATNVETNLSQDAVSAPNGEHRVPYFLARWISMASRRCPAS